MLQLCCSTVLCMLLLVCVLVNACEDVNTTAGQNIILSCRAPNYNIIVADWSRADLGSEYVPLYWDGRFDPENQHPSFKNRVDLQDRQMKDGDVSLILKDVTINDAETYECCVVQRGNNRGTRAVLKNNPISITLSVVDPPGQTGGDTEDGGKEDGVNRGRPGLSVFAVICVLIAAFAISGKLKNTNSSLPPPEQQQV